jgi:chromosome segregation ATPase
MSESESSRPEPSIEPSGEKSDSNPDAMSPEKDYGRGATGENETLPGLSGELEGKNSHLERFSYLSSEMIGLISELYQAVQNAVHEQRTAEAELKQKRNDLKALYGFEESTAELGQIVEAHKQQISDLEHVLESRRDAIEREKSRWQQEEAEYLENRKIRRQREEEEYRQQRAAEQEKARQALEEDLRKIQQKSQQELESLKQRLSEREERIQRKESELNLLIQELERFMSNLASHTQSQQSETRSLTDPELAARHEAPDGTPDLDETEAPDSQIGW